MIIRIIYMVDKNYLRKAKREIGIKGILSNIRVYMRNYGGIVKEEIHESFASNLVQIFN